MTPRLITPFERGVLAHKAGCTIHDYPLSLGEGGLAEWRCGWQSVPDKQEALEKIYQNDLGKFYPDATGEME